MYSLLWHNIFKSRDIPNLPSTNLNVYNNVFLNMTQKQSLKSKESVGHVPFLLCYLVNISAETRGVVSEGR